MNYVILLKAKPYIRTKKGKLERVSGYQGRVKKWSYPNWKLPWELSEKEFTQSAKLGKLDPFGDDEVKEVIEGRKPIVALGGGKVRDAKIVSANPELALIKIGIMNYAIRKDRSRELSQLVQRVKQSESKQSRTTKEYLEDGIEYGKLMGYSFNDVNKWVANSLGSEVGKNNMLVINYSKAYKKLIEMFGGKNDR